MGHRRGGTILRSDSGDEPDMCSPWAKPKCAKPLARPSSAGTVDLGTDGHIKGLRWRQMTLVAVRPRDLAGSFEARPWRALDPQSAGSSRPGRSVRLRPSQGP